MEERSLGKNSGRQKYDPSIEEKLQRASEAEAMHSHRETLKNLSVRWQEAEKQVGSHGNAIKKFRF